MGSAMGYTSNFEPDSIYLLRGGIADRKELRRLRKLPAFGCRGPNDFTDSGGELFCPGGRCNERNGAWFVAWELRSLNPEINSNPDSVERLST
jgi:hypothetical protein